MKESYLLIYWYILVNMHKNDKSFILSLFSELSKYFDSVDYE